MSVLDWLLLLTFIAGLVPSVIFTTLYAYKSAWSTTDAGRAVMTLMSVIAATYLSSVATLVFSEFFLDTPGVILRIIVRTACAIALIKMCRVLIVAQRPAERQRADRADERERFPG